MLFNIAFKLLTRTAEKTRKTEAGGVEVILVDADDVIVPENFRNKVLHTTMKFLIAGKVLGIDRLIKEKQNICEGHGTTVIIQVYK